jgi:GxxExxY protein
MGKRKATRLTRHRATKTETTVQQLRVHAMHIMKSLGKGHSERVYHRALITLFNRKGVIHRSEVLSPVYFMNEVVGMGRCDLVVGNLVIEIKANSVPPSKAASQLQKYTWSLARTERRKMSGVIVNFNQKTGAVQMYQPTFD